MLAPHVEQITGRKLCRGSPGNEQRRAAVKDLWGRMRMILMTVEQESKQHMTCCCAHAGDGS